MMAAGKIYNDISKMKYILKVIEQYNNFTQQNSIEEINYLKEKVNKLLTITDSEELIKEFIWCAKYTNALYDDVDSEFKQHVLKEEEDLF